MNKLSVGKAYALHFSTGFKESISFPLREKYPEMTQERGDIAGTVHSGLCA